MGSDGDATAIVSTTIATHKLMRFDDSVMRQYGKGDGFGLNAALIQLMYSNSNIVRAGMALLPNGPTTS